ncbi:MAG TPA: DUF6320 domain-containing protein [Hanamia sp.]|nr:DUF6320 domain-containing protein [Hanamia sp.]
MNEMKYCANCEVELEEGMTRCPLCGSVAVNDDTPRKQPENIHVDQEIEYKSGVQQLTKHQKALTWEIVSLILVSVIFATLLINFILNKRITWAVYPVAACVAAFSYTSFFAFSRYGIVMRLAGGFIISSVVLLIAGLFISGVDWTYKIAIPLLFFASIIAAALAELVRVSRYKGINLIAYAFIGSGVLCLFIDGVLSFYHQHEVHLWWSVIVAICVLLVAIVLMFLHFRLKKGRSLEKTFHI